jgi:hypothetical protein
MKNVKIIMRMIDLDEERIEIETRLKLKLKLKLKFYDRFHQDDKKINQNKIN